MTTAAAAAGAGAVLAWLGVALLTASEGRRGLATGLAVAAAGLAMAAGAAGQPPAAVTALAAGGLVAAVLRLRPRRGQPGWNVLPPGSTPRVVAAIAVPIAAALVAGSGLGSPAGTARLAALVVALMAGVRVLTAGQGWSALAAGSALALGLGALGGPTALVAGAAASAALGAMDGVERSEAAG
jgi:hypothetical protein